MQARINWSELLSYGLECTFNETNKGGREVINNIEGQSKSELIKIVTEQQSHDIQREAYIKSLQSESDDLRTQLAKANERVSDLESKLEAVTQEARIQACELDTQKGIVQSVQDKFNLRVYDFNISKALDIALNKFAIEKKCEGVGDFVEKFNIEYGGGYGDALKEYSETYCEQIFKERN